MNTLLMEIIKKYKILLGSSVVVFIASLLVNNSILEIAAVVLPLVFIYNFNVVDQRSGHWNYIESLGINPLQIYVVRFVLPVIFTMIMWIPGDQNFTLELVDGTLFDSFLSIVAIVTCSLFVSTPGSFVLWSVLSKMAIQMTNPILFFGVCFAFVIAFYKIQGQRVERSKALIAFVIGCIFSLVANYTVPAALRVFVDSKDPQVALTAAIKLLKKRTSDKKAFNVVEGIVLDKKSDSYDVKRALKAIRKTKFKISGGEKFWEMRLTDPLLGGGDLRMYVNYLIMDSSKYDFLTEEFVNKIDDNFKSTNVDLDTYKTFIELYELAGRALTKEELKMLLESDNKYDVAKALEIQSEDEIIKTIVDPVINGAVVNLLDHEIKDVRKGAYDALKEIYKETNRNKLRTLRDYKSAIYSGDPIAVKELKMKLLQN